MSKPQGISTYKSWQTALITMKTTALMTLSTIFMAVLGLIFTFAPDQAMGYFTLEPTAFVLLLIQVCGAMYLGFAMLNWMVRSGLTGGIYNRPVVVANLLHFVIVTLVLLRGVLGGQRSGVFVIGVCCYAVFAIWFGLALFTHPVKKQAG
jgi:hypothetical protein